MKELSIEEKAQRYDEALKVAKDIRNGEATYIPNGTPVIEAIFPELKEREDERIRKALKEYFINSFQNNGVAAICGVHIKDILAWVEKQGEQKPTLPKWKYKKDHTPLLRDSIILNKYGCVAKSPSGALVSDVWIIDYDELAKLPKEEFKEQGEQKPADKVEPKFKVGDWVIVSTTEGDRVVQITSIEYFKDCHPCYFTTEGRWFGNRTKARLLTDKDVEIITLPESKVIVNQKPAWSEEDEKMLGKCIDAASGYYSPEDKQSMKDWLYFLKERYTWKPSIAQLNALSIVSKGNAPDDIEAIVSLYQDLLKLREE